MKITLDLEIKIRTEDIITYKKIVVKNKVMIELMNFNKYMILIRLDYKIMTKEIKD